MYRQSRLSDRIMGKAFERSDRQNWHRPNTVRPAQHLCGQSREKRCAGSVAPGL
jgi:hypothetical protein